jgi:5-methylcytosine-specific restriction endonuclease McrA
MEESFAQEVSERAGFTCEYCNLPQVHHPGPFEVEHVIPKQHGGPTRLSNLAYSCLHWK